MNRQLGTVARHRVMHRRPHFPIFDTGFRCFDFGLHRQLVDLHRLDQHVDLFLAFDVTHFIEDGRRIDEIGLRKSFADLFPGAVEDGAFRRARAFDIAEAGDADTAPLDV